MPTNVLENKHRALSTDFLFGPSNKSTEGARMMTGSELGRWLNLKNTGLLLDGDSLRLSERESFQNLCLIAGIGTGKTTRLVIPNIYERAKQNCSVVVNDPKGTIFQKTSGYMQAHGFKVILLDIDDPVNFFNPLLEARDDIELEQIAEILVRSGSSEAASEKFWNAGATRLISCLLKLLKRAGKENPAYFTLGNLYRLLQNFGDGSGLDSFVTWWAYNHDDPSDSKLMDEWKGVMTGNDEAISSFALTALTALRYFTNENLVKLTSVSSFALDDLRAEKTIIYLKIPSQHLEYYGFWMSLFFRSVFNACMRELPEERGLPIYLFLDEFGHMTIPGFVSVANTIREYKVSLTIVLQSLSQITARYGRDYAYSIQGGFLSYLTYPGSDAITRSFFQDLCGEVVEKHRDKDRDKRESRLQYHLLDAGRIRTIPDETALLVSSNKHPVGFKTETYYQSGRFGKIAEKYQEATVQTNLGLVEIKSVPLRS